MWQDLLKKELSNFNIDISEEEINLFNIYMEEILFWNKKINITSIIKKEEIAIKHFLDSLTFLNEINRNATLLDIGTGGGFPSLPIKILRKDTEIYLLDSSRKRINFLKNLIRKLNLKNIHTINERIEDLKNNNKFIKKFDIITSRAFSSLVFFIKESLSLLKDDGNLLAMKGKNYREELLEFNKEMINNDLLIKTKEYKITSFDLNRAIIFIRKK